MPNVEALLKLVEILESLPDEAVDLQSWACCAIGHAALHPWFSERGFRLTSDYQPVFHQLKNGKLFFYWYWDAVETFFGLKDYISEWLFCSEYYLSCKDGETKDSFYQKQQKVGIRQQVINRIKEFLNGI